MKLVRIAIFASGSGSNAQRLIEKSADCIYEVACVVYNRKSAGVKTRAEELGIPSLYYSKKSFEDACPVLIDYLNYLKIEVIALAGFLLKIPDTLLGAYPNRILNIHPSLLPKHGGAGFYGMHVHNAVMESNDTETGITIHLVNEDYDQGEILFQARIDVAPSKEAEMLAQRVLTLEHTYYPIVVDRFCRNLVTS